MFTDISKQLKHTIIGEFPKQIFEHFCVGPKPIEEGKVKTVHKQYIHHQCFIFRFSKGGGLF